MDEPIDAVELLVKRHVRALFSEKNWNNESAIFSYTPPNRRMMNILKDVLIHANESYYPVENERQAFERDCRSKIEQDIAVVIAVIGSPTYSRVKKSFRVTLGDMLALLGKYRVF